MSVKGKIDQSGVLYIARAGRLVEQICPYGEFKNCSHHCPLFGEPFWHSRFNAPALSLCGKLVIIFDCFVDERQFPNNDEMDTGD